MGKMDLNKAEGVLIHCSATRKDSKISVDTIRKWHLDRGWNDIGYHYYITQDGFVHSGRPINVIGAHCKGKNSTHLGICLEGGVAKDGKTPENNFSPEQFNSLKGLLIILKNNIAENLVEIAGHNQYSNKACPSFDVKEWCKNENISFENM